MKTRATARRVAGPTTVVGARSARLAALVSVVVIVTAVATPVRAEPTRAAPTAAAHAGARLYVALHLQHYTGMCGDAYAVAGSGRPTPICNYDDAAAAGPQAGPSAAMRASVDAHGVR